MGRVSIRLAGELQRHRAKQVIDEAPAGYVVTVGEETRSDRQNRLMWAVIRDIREQVPAHAEFSPDDTKLRFLHALGQELRFLPELDGAGMFPVGQRSSSLDKVQFGLLLDLMFAHGEREGVKWSPRAWDAFAEARAA